MWREMKEASRVRGESCLLSPVGEVVVAGRHVPEVGARSGYERGGGGGEVKAMSMVMVVVMVMSMVTVMVMMTIGMQYGYLYDPGLKRSSPRSDACAHRDGGRWREMFTCTIRA